MPSGLAIEHDLGVVDNASDAPIIEMTTKTSRQVLNVVFVVACAVAGVTAGDVSPWVGLLSGSVLMVGAFRDYIRVEDGVLFRRTIKGWDPPMVLATVQKVEVCRMAGLKDYPHTVVFLVGEDGTRRTVSLRWWTNWQPLLAAITAAVTTPVPGQPGLLTWRPDVDEGTRRRLAPYLP